MSAPTPHQLDTLFRVLADNRRRYVLYCFEETDQTVVSLTDLAEQLVTWERQWDDTTDRSESKHRKRIRIALHHDHLPRLADANLIEYDARSEMVRQWNTDALDRCVEANADELTRLFDVFNLSEASP